MGAVARRRMLVIGGGLAIVLAAVGTWGALRGRPLPQALWSTKLLRAACGDKTDQQACIRACDRGVFDETGCLGAGQLAGRDDDQRAEHSMYAERACRGGIVEGCLDWQSYSAHVAPHASKREYLAWLTPSAYACDLGDQARCRWIASAALGVDSALVRRMLARVCAAGRADLTKDECLRQGEQRIAAVDELAPACARGDPLACSDIVGHALNNRSHALAIEALAEVCALRGLDRMEWSQPECGDVFLRFPVYPEGRKGACAIALMDGAVPMSRTRSGLLGTVPSSTDTAEGDQSEPEVPLRAKASIRVETAEPASLADGIRSLITVQLPAFGRCYERALDANPTLHGPMSIAFMVDRLGDLLLVGDGGSEVPDQKMIACIVRRVQTTAHDRLPPPSEPVRGKVRLSLTWNPTESELKAAFKAHCKKAGLLGCM